MKSRIIPEAVDEAKLLILIIDGMTDPHFRVSDYPAMASMSELEPVDYSAGGTPETLACTLRILGLKEIPSHIRPIVEAYGAGLEVAPDDLWLRGSWYHLDDEGRPDYQEEPEDTVLYRDGVEVHDLGQGHWLLRLPGCRDRAGGLTLPQPFLEGVEDYLPRGDEEIRQLLAHYRLPHHRLIAWDYGVLQELPSVDRGGVIIAAEPVLLGIGRLLGWSVVTDPRLTGDTDTDLGTMLRLIGEAATEHDLVLAHLNGADQVSHRLDPEGKRSFLRRVDSELVAPLLRQGLPLLLTSDHGSDPLTGRHLPGPQPRLRS